MIAARTEGEAGAPLLLTFHGTGGDEGQFHGIGPRLLPGAHIVSPRGEVSEGGMLRFFRRTGEGVYDMEDLGRRTAAMADFGDEEWPGMLCIETANAADNAVKLKPGEKHTMKATIGV